MDEILEFFSEICELTADKISIEEENGRRSGKGLVEFESEEKAQDAKDALNRKEIQGRFITLHDQADKMWESITQGAWMVFKSLYFTFDSDSKSVSLYSSQGLLLICH